MQTVTKLINQFTPTNYQLSISLNRLDRTFGGVVTILGQSQPESNNITLHSKNLDIKTITIDGKDATFAFGDDDTLIIYHPDISVGEHTVVVDYGAKITDSMHGLYPCYYELDGAKKELLATQFESHFAREVLPCIDEPAAKATFDVTLTTETGVTVLGNMPIKNQTTENDKLITTFETTPPMSSYLLAWVVGELHKKTAYTKSGVEVNVWATPAQPADNLDFALDIATRTIDFFNEYFDTPYPLPKSDQVALPDFSMGAMENWGLVTYRETALLVDPNIASVSSKHYVATVITHELSHQWFGNLVTMKWWNDLWLNESFATLIEYLAVDALEPSLNVLLDFSSTESLVSLRRDSLDGVQSVQTDVNHPDEITTLFDGAIVYAKGARLLQMLQKYIGEKAFQTGLKSYFKKYAYQNTEANDLWNALGEASSKDVASYMNRWISQPGFPVLHVTKDGNKISLSQERLTCNANKTSETIWPITLNSSWPDMPELFDDRTMSVEATYTKPLRFNVGNKAHYITHYSPELLRQIIDLIKSGGLSSIDRLQILNEQTLLARAGIISSAELIPLLEAYKDEKSEPVWCIISTAISELIKFVENDKESERKLQNLSASLVRKQYDRLGWDKLPNESESDTKLRGIIIGLMIYSEDNTTIEKAIELYKSNTLNELNPDLRSSILAAAVRYAGDDSIIDSLLTAYKSTESAELKQDISGGLASTRNNTVIDKLLELLKDTDFIRPQDTSRWMVMLVKNRYGRVQTWAWERNNWDWIKQTFSGDKSYDYFPRYTATALMTRDQLEEYRTFFTPLLSDPTLTRVISMGINEISSRVESIERDGATVREALLNL